MKLQIDTVLKIIKIEHTVNLSELIKVLADMFPDGAWREYSIEPTSINGPIPIFIDPRPPVQPYNQRWPEEPRVIYDSGTPPPMFQPGITGPVIDMSSGRHQELFCATLKKGLDG